MNSTIPSNRIKETINLDGGGVSSNTSGGSSSSDNNDIINTMNFLGIKMPINSNKNINRMNYLSHMG